MHKAREIFRSGALGKVPLVRTYIDQAAASSSWKFYTDYSITEMPKDASVETIDWNRFIANAPKRSFDAERFFTWRCYWDYGTGIAGDLLTHLWDGVNMVMGMGIPESAVTQGGTYFWKGDREVPDMWHVLFDYPKQQLAVSFATSPFIPVIREKYSNSSGGSKRWKCHPNIAVPTLPNGSRSIRPNAPQPENGRPNWAFQRAVCLSPPTMLFRMAN